MLLFTSALIFAVNAIFVTATIADSTSNAYYGDGISPVIDENVFLVF